MQKAGLVTLLLAFITLGAMGQEEIKIELAWGTGTEDIIEVHTVFAPCGAVIGNEAKATKFTVANETKTVRTVPKRILMAYQDSSGTVWCRLPGSDNRPGDEWEGYTINTLPTNANLTEWAADRLFDHGWRNINQPEMVVYLPSEDHRGPCGA